MIRFLRCLKLPEFLHPSTGLLYVFPNHKGGYDKHPQYKENYKARMKFLDTCMQPNQFLRKQCENHLNSYIDLLHSRDGYRDYYDNLHCHKNYGKGAGKGPAGDAEMVADSNVKIPVEQQLMTEVNEMNAEVENLHMYNVLKNMFKDKICFRTLLVRDHA